MRVDERVDTGESVIRKVLLVESGGADGEGDWESSVFEYSVNFKPGNYLAEYLFK